MTALAARLALLVPLLGASPGSASPAPAPGPGVSHALARHRAAILSDLRYRISLAIPADAARPIDGSETVEFTLSDPSQPLVLDFQQGADHVHAVRAGDRSVDVDVVAGHIVVPASALRAGRNTLSIDFVAGDGSLNRSADHLYALFVPDRASVALPLFDQPDLKARFTLSLVLPAGWVAVSNGGELDTTPAAVGGAGAAAARSHAAASASASAAAPTVRHDFAETRPISTYLFTFAAGKWRVETAVRDGRTFRMFHRESDSARVARNRDRIFDLQASALAWLETYTGIDYPFGKFDFVAVPAFQFGGMEHPGAIYYRAESLFLDESATQSQLLGRASLIAHETAHMWFGDLVTMRWFDDVWTKEVFANFMAAKVVNPAFPEVDHTLRFYLAHFPSAYAIDRTAGANPIRQPLDNLRDAGTLYGAIIYDKAPIVMQHLENLLGPDGFRDGLREYLRRYRFGNATWNDLVAILDRRTPRDLAAWSHVWVEEAGRPTLAAHLDYDGAGRISRLVVTQSDPARGGRLWPQRLRVQLGWAGRARGFDIDLDGDSAVVADAAGLPAPEYVLPGAGALGYADFRLDPASRETLLRRLPELRDARVRAVAWLTLHDALLEGDVAPADFVDLGLRSLPAETSELDAQRILADVGGVFWRFLSPTQRSRVAPRLEALLWERMRDVPEPTLKATYFNAFRDIATTPLALERLRGLWSGDSAIAGLALSERDRTTVALALALRGAPASDSILRAQLTAVSDPDRRARLRYLLPAVSRDAAVRDSFFAALRDPAARRHESWALDGMRLVSHPLHADHAIRYIRPALDVLEEIQRTGDIFFPGRWLDATLDAHSSPRAAAIVRAFLAEHPRYPPKLREKILQSADGLFRAARLREAAEHAAPDGEHPAGSGASAAGRGGRRP